MSSNTFYLGFAQLGMPPLVLRRLSEFCGGIEAAWTAPLAVWKEAGVPPRILKEAAGRGAINLAAEFERLSKRGIGFVSLSDRGYPLLLKELPDPPFGLFFMGDLGALARPAVAVVGSRTPTEYGRTVALQLARGIAERGITVVSGFARGIDREAHTAALSSGGPTAAVLGCGLGIDYPRGSGRLKLQIAEHGSVLSEFAPETEPRPEFFPQRNRIIAGLAQTTIVVEGSESSGSLVTARLAAEYGREVAAVPGSVFNPLARGPHRLIADGAVPITSIEAYLDLLGPTEEPASVPALTGPPGQILFELQRGPLHPDLLAVKIDCAPNEVQAILTELELRKRVKRLPTGAFALYNSTP